MSAALRPLEFNGTTDRAVKHLFLALIGRYGTVPEEILNEINEVVACDQITFNPTFDAGMPPPKVEEYAIVPRRLSPSSLPYMNLGTFALEWVDSEGYTRIGIKPDPPFHEALAGLWRWLRDALNGQGLLVGAMARAETREEEDVPWHVPEPEPEWWASEVDRPDIQLIRDWQELKGDSEKLMKRWGLSTKKMANEKSSKLRRKYKDRRGQGFALEILPYQEDLAEHLPDRQ